MYEKNEYVCRLWVYNIQNITTNATKEISLFFNVYFDEVFGIIHMEWYIICNLFYCIAYLIKVMANNMRKEDEKVFLKWLFISCYASHDKR